MLLDTRPLHVCRVADTVHASTLRVYQASGVPPSPRARPACKLPTLTWYICCVNSSSLRRMT